MTFVIGFRAQLYNPNDLIAFVYKDPSYQVRLPALVPGIRA